MPGQYTFRVIVICPVGAKLTGVVNWLNANVGASTTAASWPGLSASGTAPATHRWWNAAVTDAEALAILTRCCELASVTPKTPQEWAGMTNAQKKSWLVSVHNALLSGFGIGVWLAVQDGLWDDPDAALSGMGLSRIVTGAGA